MIDQGSHGVLAFGARIVGAVTKRDAIQIELFEAPQYQRASRKLEDLGGTRHQSAVHYAAKYAGAFVLVVSQDGRASVIQRPSGSEPIVRVYRGFEAALPLDADTLTYGRFGPIASVRLGARTRCGTLPGPVPPWRGTGDHDAVESVATIAWRMP